jgi:hypothetical protein
MENKNNNNNNTIVVKLVDSFDYSLVDIPDRPYVKTVLLGIANFSPMMPHLKVKCHPSDEFYKISITGWNQPVNLLIFAKTFLIQGTREQKYDVIKSIEMIPSDDDGKFVTVFFVERSSRDAIVDKRFK